MKNRLLVCLMLSLCSFCGVIHADNIYLTEGETELLVTNQEPEYIKAYTHIFINEANSTYSKLNKSSLSGLPYQQEVKVAAIKTGLEEALIHAVIAVESGYNPIAKSKKGAYGLMQLMPETAKKYQAERKNPKENIMAGAKYLSYLLSMFDNNLPLALAAYNAGPAAILKHGLKIPPYIETRNYVPKVITLYNRLSS